MASTKVEIPPYGCATPSLPASVTSTSIGVAPLTIGLEPLVQPPARAFFSFSLSCVSRLDVSIWSVISLAGIPLLSTLTGFSPVDPSCVM